jgi:HlyD family secretion protein
MRRLLSLLILVALAGCEKPATDALQGYVEGEFALVASSYAGQLQKLYVRRGDRVEAGKALFALEQENERAQRLEAEEQLKNSQARLANLQLAKRAPEIATVQAQLEQARAARALAKTQLAQQDKLFKGGFTSQVALDQARTTYEQSVGRVAEMEAQLRTARLPLGRDEERQGAEREVKAAQANLAQAAWRLEQKSVAAPVSALVQDTFFVEGEWVPAGRPVASLLPPGNVKVRFYVPETILGSIQTGREVVIGCDGCPQPIPAKVSYISSQAEYTPPVLYTREQRQKLMYLIEARPDPALAGGLRPGQPVDIRLK